MGEHNELENWVDLAIKHLDDKGWGYVHRIVKMYDILVPCPMSHMHDGQQPGCLICDETGQIPFNRIHALVMRNSIAEPMMLMVNSHKMDLTDRPMAEIQRMATIWYLQQLVVRFHGNISQASRHAKVSRRHLRDLLKKSDLYELTCQLRETRLCSSRSRSCLPDTSNADNGEDNASN